MHEIDREDTIRRYTKRFAIYGYSPETLGWGKGGRQAVRFSVLADPVLASPSSSVLDVGCGFADLYDYLVGRGWRGNYTGLDIVPEFIRLARERRPGLDLRERDVTSDPRNAAELAQYDFVLASGIFNAKHKMQDNEQYIQQTLYTMFRQANVAICVDFLSIYVDYRHPESWHTDPCRALMIAQQLSRRCVLRLDYMPFEFALVIYKDDSISDRNVFQAYDPSE